MKYHKILRVPDRSRIAWKMCRTFPRLVSIQRNNFFDVRDGDFQRGMNKAVANNWITIDLHNRYRYHLTATGYAVGRMIDPTLGQPINFVGP